MRLITLLLTLAAGYWVWMQWSGGTIGVKAPQVQTSPTLQRVDDAARRIQAAEADHAQQVQDSWR